jgi:hypothetical protein
MFAMRLITSCHIAFRFLEHAHIVLGRVLTSLNTMLGQLLTMATQLRYSFLLYLPAAAEMLNFTT